MTIIDPGQSLDFNILPLSTEGNRLFSPFFSKVYQAGVKYN